MTRRHLAFAIVGVVTVILLVSAVLMASSGPAPPPPRHQAIRVTTPRAEGLANPRPTLAGIIGAPTPGQVLTTSNGTWTNNPTTFAYQWQRCVPAGACQNITSAAAQTYTVANADVGYQLRSVVSASNAAGTATQYAAPTQTVLPPQNPVNVTLPAITCPTTGCTAVHPGDGLSADVGTWQYATSYTYQWKQCDTAGANCAPIAAATGPTYTITPALIGYTIRVTVTAHSLLGLTRRTTPIPGGSPA